MINEERRKLKTAQKRFRREVCFINRTKPDHTATSPVSPVRPPQGNTSPLNHQRRTVQSLMVPEVAGTTISRTISSFCFPLQSNDRSTFSKRRFYLIFFSFQFFRRKRCDRNAETTLARHYFFLLYINWKKNLFHLIINLCRCVYHTQLGYAKNIVLKANIYRPLNVFTGITLNFSILLIGKKIGNLYSLHISYVKRFYP